MIKRIVLGLIEGFIRNIGGPLGIKIRYFYYKRRLGYCGNNVVIDEGVFFQSPENIYLGSKIWLDKNVILLAGSPNLDRNIIIKDNSKFENKMGQIHIGDSVHIAPNVVIQGHGGVSIGANTGVASGSKIYSLSHHYKTTNKEDKKKYFFTPMVLNEEQSLICSPVFIGYGCAIGLNAIILPGCIINDYCWIGTGLICSKEYEESAVYYVNFPQEVKKI